METKIKEKQTPSASSIVSTPTRSQNMNALGEKCCGRLEEVESNQKRLFETGGI